MAENWWDDSLIYCKKNSNILKTDPKHNLHHIVKKDESPVHDSKTEQPEILPCRIFETQPLCPVAKSVTTNHVITPEQHARAMANMQQG